MTLTCMSATLKAMLSPSSARGGGDGGDECAAGGLNKLTRERLREAVEVVRVG